jgi:signal transduction histidine kinase
MHMRMIRTGLLRWFWIPINIVVFGILAVIMIIWTQHIGDGVRTGYIIESALMDAQIRASNFHLWFEEGIAGDADVDLQNTWADLDHASALLSAILDGGKTEHDPVLRPLIDPATRNRVKEMRSLLDRLRAIGGDRQKTPTLSGIGSILDDRFDAIFISFMGKTRDLELEVEQERASSLARSRRLFWTILIVWVSIVLTATLGLWSLERRRRSAEEALQRANGQLKSQADELLSHHQHLAELVQERTAELRGANESLQSEIVERRYVENELRRSERELQFLSARILTAQEEERSRISRELHDEMGQSLATLKLRIGSIGKRPEAQPLRTECKEILGHIDEIIEETRRLSRALSPTVLEYLGLSVAIRRMVEDFVKDREIDVELDIAALEDLLPKHAQLIVYRVFQEALNNIGKHAQATHLIVTMERDNGSMRFVLEDNGDGFDMYGTIGKDPGGMGMGLAIMNERVRMLGGTLYLWSQKGKGTRISFHIPASVEEDFDGALSHSAG